MFPFVSADIPDQFYRLFTSLCLHAGIIHLAITIAFQHIYLADLERLLGPIRTAILYIGCGIAGNMTSAIFLPYKPEVSPNDPMLTEQKQRSVTRFLNGVPSLLAKTLLN